MLKKILLILILFLSVGFVCADTLKFVQVTDVHLQKDGYISIGGRDLSKSEDSLREFIKVLNKDNSAQYVFFTGDEVDRSYDYLWSNFFDIADHLNKPYYLCLGNHDSNSLNGYNKSEVLDYIQERSMFRQESPNFVVNLNDKFVAIVFDATADNKISSQGFVKEETLNWLDKVLEENKDKYVILLNHFPVREPMNDKKLEIPHNIKNKKELIKLIKKHPNIVIFMSGHYHLKGEYKRYGIKHYSTPAFYNFPNYYRVVEIDYDKKINSIKSNLKKIHQ